MGLSRTTRAGRTQARHAAIAATLRAEIVGGAWVPGARLPTRVDLIASMEASGPTIQRALDQLRADGFVETRGRNGTYVTAYPPHTHRIAVCFPAPRAPMPGPNWSGMWHAIDAALANEAGYFPVRFGRYYGLLQADGPDMARLSRDLQRHRVAGLLNLVGTTQILTRQHLDARPPLQDGRFSAGIPVNIQPYDRTIARLAAKRGVRRVGVIASSLRADSESRWRATLQVQGLQLDASLFATIHPDHVAEARRIALLMAGQELARRPQWLIIEDDHLVEPVTIGIRESGLRVPQDLQLIAHTNFPTPPPAQMQTLRVGYDMRQLIDMLVDLVTHPKRKSTGPIELPAVFDDQLQLPT